ncbi:TonB-dependent receptor [Aquisediminimonas sediminicola]|uniref:TonB-dependent receptor n=1 Tax=Alteraquisediminimonas sediminicola TaxID=2676787 RepID=UPI001C8E64D6|nr:TonB-dependent receptor [Aquisediminimonas sediminicola]
MKRVINPAWGRGLMLAGASVMTLSLAPAMAQEAEQTAKATHSGLEEITVTARKRVEDVQSVPIAVTGISGAALENRFVADVRQVAKYIPNVQLGQVQFSGATLSASIRGLTFADIERSFEPAVATSIDGIFLASNTGALVDTFDLESIEVLRGPQGTLFGRNTIGGIINIRRSRPTGEFGAKLSATVGAYGRNDYKAVINAPIMPGVLAAKLGIFSINGDSFTRSAYTGKRDPGLDRLDITGTLLFTPTSDFEALFTYEHMKDRSHYPQLVNMSRAGSLACDTFNLCYENHQQAYESSGFKASFAGTPFYVPMNANNFTLNSKYSGENFNITSVTGYLKNNDALDIDNIGDSLTPTLPLFNPKRKLHGKQFSQELRVDTEFDGVFNIVAGLYYFDSTYRLDYQDVYVAGNLVDKFTAGQHAKSYAAFAETYWKLSDATRVTVGGRYTKEKKRFHVTKYTDVPPYSCPDVTSNYAPCRDPNLTFKKFTPRVSIDHKWADDIMTYVSWSRGFRSGGWNGRPGSLAETIGPYEPETVDSYEAGFRSKFLDNTALFNLTVFQTNYKNKQEDQIRANPLNPQSTITFVENASEARFRGVEVEAQYKPTDNLHMFASAGYLKGKYLSFPDAAGNDLSATKNLRYAPDWNASFGGDYTIPFGADDSRFVIGANVKYVGDYATESGKDNLGLNREIIPSHTSVDASVSYYGKFAGVTEYKLSAFVNDAFHGGGRVVRSSQAGIFWFGDRTPNRTWGVEMQLEF